MQIHYSLTILLIASLVCGGCAKNGKNVAGLQNVLLIGEVISERSEKQISEALVEIKKDDKVFISTYSDQSGKFRFDELPSGEFDLVVTKGDKYAIYNFNEETKTILNAAEFANGRRFLRVPMKAKQTTIKGQIVSDHLEVVVGAVITTYPPTVEVQSEEGGVFQLDSDLFEEGIIYYLQITHPDFDAKQFKIQNLLIPQENQIPAIEVKTRKINRGIDGKEKHHDDAPGISTPSSG